MDLRNGFRSFARPQPQVPAEPHADLPKGARVMKWPTVGIIAACVALTPSPTFSKASLILPRTDFPTHTKIRVYRSASNAAFDHAQGCLASFGGPFFHDVCADALNR